MGVPLHHLVLPVSGCLSRRTPTRATRGEARGHRSVLAQNSLFMPPPPSFSVLWTCRRPGVFSPYGGLDPMWLRCCGSIPAWFRRSRYFVYLWVAEGHTARWPWLCVLFVHRPRCGCRPASGMSTPSRCRPLVHSKRQGWCYPLGKNGSCEVVSVNRGRRTHIW